MFPDAAFLSTLDFEDPTLARAFRFQIHIARTLLAIIHPKHAVPIRRVKPQPFPAERLAARTSRPIRHRQTAPTRYRLIHLSAD